MKSKIEKLITLIEQAPAAQLTTPRDASFHLIENGKEQWCPMGLAAKAQKRFSHLSYCLRAEIQFGISHVDCWDLTSIYDHSSSKEKGRQAVLARLREMLPS